MRLVGGHGSEALKGRQKPAKAVRPGTGRGPSSSSPERAAHTRTAHLCRAYSPQSICGSVNSRPYGLRWILPGLQPLARASPFPSYMLLEQLLHLARPAPELPLGGTPEQLAAACRRWGLPGCRKPRSDDVRDWLCEVTPTFKWWWPHLAYVQERLEAQAQGEIQNLMVLCPPQHGKSELPSRSGIRSGRAPADPV